MIKLELVEKESKDIVIIMCNSVMFIGEKIKAVTYEMGRLDLDKKEFQLIRIDGESFFKYDDGSLPF